MPKLTAFAVRRISGVTPSAATPKTAAAVREWMSSPDSKAFRIAASPERWARIRSSICE